MVLAIGPAVVLLSGGLDSATTLAIARNEGYACHCLSVNYGQRHRAELDAAGRVARALGAAPPEELHRTSCVAAAGELGHRGCHSLRPTVLCQCYSVHRIE